MVAMMMVVVRAAVVLVVVVSLPSQPPVQKPVVQKASPF
jgi:hypothetical protein